MFSGQWSRITLRTALGEVVPRAVPRRYSQLVDLLSLLIIFQVPDKETFYETQLNRGERG